MTVSIARFFKKKGFNTSSEQHQDGYFIYVGNGKDAFSGDITACFSKDRINRAYALDNPTSIPKGHLKELIAMGAKIYW